MGIGASCVRYGHRPGRADCSGLGVRARYRKHPDSFQRRALCRAPIHGTPVFNVPRRGHVSGVGGVGVGTGDGLASNDDSLLGFETSPGTIHCAKLQLPVNSRGRSLSMPSEEELDGKCERLKRPDVRGSLCVVVSTSNDQTGPSREL
ncbi:hypothetical protein DPMN_012049 [Dreissena polymorpha]|uniref:Uncharacterized protein n=1 Tax=Dreissena polymorpha TaxID=45954 RepID=A0A9D4S2G3_DREPO|nr:hypothetical protein DPMN_012049 [Dreissena polymorpha]